MNVGVGVCVCVFVGYCLRVRLCVIEGVWVCMWMCMRM